MKTMDFENKLIKASGLIAALSAVLVLSGCGKQEFTVGSSEVAQTAPGHFQVPAKVDILLAVDNTGSMYEAYDTFKNQMPQFVQDLESKGWDYHLATIPLVSLPGQTTNPQNPVVRPINQVLTAKYDGNWAPLGGWSAPFPGATPTSPGLSIPASFFRTPYNYTHFISNSDINVQQGTSEAGLEMIRKSLIHSSAASSGFLRNDALLVVILASTGNDTSGASICQVSGQPPQWCWGSLPSGAPDTYGAANLDWYRQQLQAVKALPNQIQLYTAVSPYNYSSCLGTAARAGTRYVNFAGMMGGQSYDICAQSISSALNSMASSLQSQRLSYRQRFLVLSHQPDTSTIRVIKHPGGDPNVSVEIPQSSVDGWTYAGYTSQYLIDYPVPLNWTTGYMVELHGGARLTGTDTAEVLFSPYTGP